MGWAEGPSMRFLMLVSSCNSQRGPWELLLLPRSSPAFPWCWLHFLGWMVLAFSSWRALWALVTGGHRLESLHVCVRVCRVILTACLPLLSSHMVWEFGLPGVCACMGWADGPSMRFLMLVFPLATPSVAHGSCFFSLVPLLHFLSVGCISWGGWCWLFPLGGLCGL